MCCVSSCLIYILLSLMSILSSSLITDHVRFLLISWGWWWWHDHHIANIHSSMWSISKMPPIFRERWTVDGSEKEQQNLVEGTSITPTVKSISDSAAKQPAWCCSHYVVWVQPCFLPAAKSSIPAFFSFLYSLWEKYRFQLSGPQKGFWWWQTWPDSHSHTYKPSTKAKIIRTSLVQNKVARNSLVFKLHRFPGPFRESSGKRPWQSSKLSQSRVVTIQLNNQHHWQHILLLQRWWKEEARQ